MQVELTKQQYRDLLDLVYLGDWMVNAIRDPGQEVKKYTDLEQYVMSFAEEHGFGDLVEYDDKFQQYFHTRAFEESEVDEYRQEYDEENFWEDLVYRLSRRDLLRQCGEKKVARLLGSRELFDKEAPLEDRYREEIGAHGLDRLEVAEHKREVKQPPA